MKRIMIVVGAVLALGLSSTAAIAATADEPVDCATAIEALVAARADADAGDAEIEQLRDEQEALDKAVADAQAALDEATDPAEIPALQAALNVAKKAAEDAQAVLDEKVAADEVLNQLVIDAQVKVSELCGNEDPAPDPADLDCSDFPLADGRTAQDVLDETPNTDPHNLDIDGDRIACEYGDVDDQPTQIRLVPSKAPATGSA